MSAVLATLF